MLLYLIRHGDSESSAKTDEERALTPEGRESVVQMARHIAQLGAAPAVLLSSPLIRARETAEAFCRAWSMEMRTVDWLLPPLHPSQVLEELRKLRETEIALVGHLPNLGLILGTLIWGLPPKEVVIPKAGVAYLKLTSWDPGTAKLQWLLTPATTTSSA
jgi:phosphohistidine phosphatase